VFWEKRKSYFQNLAQKRNENTKEKNFFEGNVRVGKKAPYFFCLFLRTVFHQNLTVTTDRIVVLAKKSLEWGKKNFSCLLKNAFEVVCTKTARFFLFSSSKEPARFCLF